MGMLVHGPDALRADLQRFYGLDLDDLGTSIRVGRAADLAANLPAEAMVWRRLDPRLEWPAQLQLLANIADRVDFLAWAQSKDAQKRGAKWDNPVPRPGTDKRGNGRREKDIAPMPPGELARRLRLTPDAHPHHN